MIDLVVTGGTVVTMDAEQRVLADGAVAIDGDRIVAVGPAEEVAARHLARRTIDARRKIVAPGLIDAHGHGGHGLLKTIASDTPSLWAESSHRSTSTSRRRATGTPRAASRRSNG